MGVVLGTANHFSQSALSRILASIPGGRGNIPIALVRVILSRGCAHLGEKMRDLGLYQIRLQGYVLSPGVNPCCSVSSDFIIVGALLVFGRTKL